jgi:hypothetical protein
MIMSSIFIWNCTSFTVFKDAFCTIIASVLIKITEHYLNFKFTRRASTKRPAKLWKEEAVQKPPRKNIY